MNRSLITMLIVGLVNLGAPALASAGADETSRSAFQRSIAVAAQRAALQVQQAPAAAAETGGSRKGCLTGGVLMGGAVAAFTTAIVKHANWTGSGETTKPGAKPPSSVGWSVAIGAVLAGAGVVTMSMSCGH